MDVIIVTGAAVSGYGQEITKLMLDNGYRVIGTHLNVDEVDAKKFANELGNENLSLFPLDLWSRNSLDEFLRNVGTTPIKGLVLSQYFWNMENQDNFDFDAWDKSIASNLTAPNYLIRKLSPNLEIGKGNSVVITSTEALTGNYGSTAYAAARAGEHNLVKSLANLLGPRKIRINAVAPGWIGNVMEDGVFDPSSKMTPLGRLGNGREVAYVVEFLLSEKASYVTGSTYVVDGGYSNADPMAKLEFEESCKS
ncbi:MAG: SDR family oxidoreductase [Fibromonadales bacterium]|nr:SDR family oxidoreductase [Fibromonadales bacterium]